MVYDIAVVGLGPSGTAFLKGVEGLNLNVIAFEALSFPRRKLCAGGLTEKAYRLLKGLFPEVDSVVRFRSKEVFLHSGKREVCVGGNSPLIYMTDRAELDYLLFRSVAEKFNIHMPERVVSVERNGSLWRLRTERDSYRARVVVASDGVNSRIANLLGVKRQIGMTFESDIEVDFDRTVIDFTGMDWGYFWVFPKGGFVTAGFGEMRRGIRGFKERMEFFLRKHGIGAGFRGSGFPIPAGRGFNKIYVDGVLLLGDAGGLVDPLTGEGIYYAARSGQIAAKSVADFFSSGDGRSLKDYEIWVNREFGGEFRWARIAGNVFFRSRNIAFRFMEREKELGRVVADVVCGRGSYRQNFFRFSKVALKSILGF